MIPITNSTQPSDATIKPLPKKRRTPTEKQMEALSKLDDEALIEKATEAMHALNRRAKKLRDTAHTYYRASFAKAVKFEKELIYGLKDLFLVALAEAGAATLYTFVVEEPGGMKCDCGHSWYGHSDECFACGGDGNPVVIDRRWFIVERGQYRFHAPRLPERFVGQAIEIEPHDPSQPTREIPEIDLTVNAQFGAVKMAIERLRTRVPSNAISSHLVTVSSRFGRPPLSDGCSASPST